MLYISRKLSKRETMYSTIEKECLAIRWVVLTLRYYLPGREFTLCSDHAAPPHEGYQRVDHPLVSGITALQIQGDPQAGDADDCSRLPLQEWGGGGGLQTGGLPGLSRAVGVCGEGGVVQRSLQREKDSGDSGK